MELSKENEALQQRMADMEAEMQRTWRRYEEEVAAKQAAMAQAEAASKAQAADAKDSGTLVQHIRYGRDGGRISRRDAHDNASNGADGASNAFAAAKDSKAERMAVKAARVAQERAEAAEDYAKGLQEKLNQAEHSVRMLRQQLYERTHGNPIHNLSAVPNRPKQNSAPGRRLRSAGQAAEDSCGRARGDQRRERRRRAAAACCAPGQEAQADVGPRMLGR